MTASNSQSRRDFSNGSPRTSVRGPRSLALAPFPALLLLALLALPTPAQATAAETEWTAGVMAGTESAGLFAGVDVGGLYNLSDFWALGGSVRDRRFLWDAPSGVTAATVDARMVLDALTWVPSLGVAAGPAWRADGLAWLGRAEVALGYRPARDWGLVFRGGAESELAAGAPLRWTFGVAWVWYRGAGIGLDL
ncbi:MAG: hypothetical protein ACOYOB_13780 [Myxococcota bacterium]